MFCGGHYTTRQRVEFAGGGGGVLALKERAIEHGSNSEVACEGMWHNHASVYPKNSEVLFQGKLRCRKSV